MNKNNGTISRQVAINELIAMREHIDAGMSVIGCTAYEMAIEALREPKSIRINFNEFVKVKLTDWGKEIYYHQYDRINQIAGREICKPKFPKEDENGYTEFQLWYFIELYGEYMGMTLPNVIEPLEIIYERCEQDG